MLLQPCASATPDPKAALSASPIANRFHRFIIALFSPVSLPSAATQQPAPNRSQKLPSNCEDVGKATQPIPALLAQIR
jgi:hypothetical protein